MIDILNREVRQCRAILFGHRLAWLVTDSYRECDLNEWLFRNWQSQWDEPISKSGRILRGALPQRNLRRFLVAKFGVLKRCLINPLWWSLSELSTDPHDRRFWNACAEAVVVNGCPLSRFEESTMNLFCGDWWGNIGLLLFIMRSDSDEFADHRYWLRSNFFVYLCITCSIYPARYAVPQIFACVDRLVRRGLLAADSLDYWPGSVDEFRGELNAYGYLLGCVRCQKWWKRKGDADPFLFIWFLRESNELMQELCSCSGGDFHVPDFLRMKWYRAARAVKSVELGLALENTNLTRLAPSDRRILTRLIQERDW